MCVCVYIYIGTNGFSRAPPAPFTSPPALLPPPSEAMAKE